MLASAICEDFGEFVLVLLLLRLRAFCIRSALPGCIFTSNEGKCCSRKLWPLFWEGVGQRRASACKGGVRKPLPMLNRHQCLLVMDALLLHVYT